MPNTETAGSAIRVMRVAQGLSLRQLAELADTSPTYISQVERGDRTPTKRWLSAIEQALADNILREREAAS